MLINHFEPLLRSFIADDLLLTHFGDKWRDFIPAGVLQDLEENKDYAPDPKEPIDEFFEELDLHHLKDIVVTKDCFTRSSPLLGEISKEKFVELMDELNLFRRKIAHAKSTYSDLDFEKTVEYVGLICQGEAGKDFARYLESEGYKSATEIPTGFLERPSCQQNLPVEDYDLDGGFIGREKEIRGLKKLILSEQDRIVTLTGAGGVGKTAVALKLAHQFLDDPENPFEALIWFSAKSTKLTAEGIVPLQMGIKSQMQLTEDILALVDPTALKNLKTASAPAESYKTYLNSLFSSQKCLLVIDNLETVLSDESVVSFVKEIPRPSMVLITSRRGLGEIERRFPIPDLPVDDAVPLFRTVAKQRGLQDLVKLPGEYISELVKGVRCYPLLIKWSIGQVLLGKDLEQSFHEILSGDSEIAKFAFNDVFSLLSEPSRKVLFSMVVYGDKPCSRFVLSHLANLTDDDLEDSLRELTLTSFVIPEVKPDGSGGAATTYNLLTLTRGFIESKLDAEKEVRESLQTRYYHLREQVTTLEQAESSYSQSLFSLGVKTTEEQISFNFVKAAKNFALKEQVKEAESNFEQALRAAPRFPYALTEYSKFEFSRGRHLRALDFAKRAVEADPKGFHARFTYGMCLKRMRRYLEARDAFEQAIGLNPSHLPIYNELGSVLTFLGDYERADMEFSKALKEEKYPNLRHQSMTFQFIARNYREWARSFGERKDIARQLEALQKALDSAKKATDLVPSDRRTWHEYRRVCIDLGVAVSKLRGFKEGRPYIEKALSPIETGEVTRGTRLIMYPDSEEEALGYYHLAAMGLAEKDSDMAAIDAWIRKGLATCPPDSKLYSRMRDLYQSIQHRLVSTPHPTVTERPGVRGRVRFFSGIRKYGLIDAADKTYLFFLSDFVDFVSIEDAKGLKGRAVTFHVTPDPSRQSGFRPVGILVEGEA